MRKSKQSGFTLIELMVVVVIIAVLMGIALPSYREYVLRSHRADGQFALTECAARQERWFTRSNSYNTTAGYCPTLSPEGYYNIAVAVFDQANDGSCTAGNTNLDCFVITATPTSKGAQTEDTTCATMTLNNMNVKTALDSASADSKSDCWK